MGLALEALACNHCNGCHVDHTGSMHHVLLADWAQMAPVVSVNQQGVPRVVQGVVQAKALVQHGDAQDWNKQSMASRSVPVLDVARLWKMAQKRILQ